MKVETKSGLGANGSADADHQWELPKPEEFATNNKHAMSVDTETSNIVFVAAGWNNANLEDDGATFEDATEIKNLALAVDAPDGVLEWAMFDTALNLQRRINRVDVPLIKGSLQSGIPVFFGSDSEWESLQYELGIHSETDSNFSPKRKESPVSHAL